MKEKAKKIGIQSISAVLFFLILWGWTGMTGLQAQGQAFRMPAYETFTLENGLTIYLMEQHEVPLIYVSAVFPAGAIHDGNRCGLASLTSEGLLMGTKNYSKAKIEEELDILGVSYNAGASLETSEVFMSFLNSHRDTVFPILKEIITEPVFEQTEFDKRKKRLLLELEQAKEAPENVIGDYYNKFLFKNHAYGNPVPGTRSSVEKITVEDLKTFYKNNYLPQGSVIALVGDFKNPEMKEQITGLFKDWQGKPAAVAETPVSAALPLADKPRVLLVNKEDATETQFIIGSFGITRNNPDYIGILLINTILGDRFTSWLNDELRVNAGLTYGVRSRFNPFKASGTFTINSFTRTATTVQALDLAVKVLNRLHKQGVDENTLSSAKNYVKGQFPLDYETPDSLAELLASMFFYKFSDSFINDFQKNIDAVTPEKAKEIIAKYFPVKNLQFVLIGKASELRDQVKKYGEITEKEIKADGF